jgi:hypothetical protein
VNLSYFHVIFISNNELLYFFINLDLLDLRILAERILVSIAVFILRLISFLCNIYFNNVFYFCKYTHYFVLCIHMVLSIHIIYFHP